jgi:enoyl-CoA hydratase/carnithine racemase
MKQNAASKTCQVSGENKMSDLIQTRQREDIFEITLNRPEKRNAINREMLAGLDTAVSQANRIPNLRAVLLRGEGAAFSAGIDVSALLGLAQEYGPHWQTAHARHYRRIPGRADPAGAAGTAHHCPAARLLSGAGPGAGPGLRHPAGGGGDQIGSARNAAGHHSRRGRHHAADAAGRSGAGQRADFHRSSFDADYAARWGIVNEVVAAEQLLPQAEALVAEIRQAAPLAVGMAKRVIDGLADIDRGLLLEGWAQSELFKTEDFMEGAQAFMMKRPPEFKGR